VCLYIVGAVALSGREGSGGRGPMGAALLEDVLILVFVLVIVAKGIP
jgi:hypothetical protein